MVTDRGKGGRVGEQRGCILPTNGVSSRNMRPLGIGELTVRVEGRCGWKKGQEVSFLEALLGTRG